jgi:hypothetical protein
MTLQRLSPLSADRACLTPFLPKPSPLAPPSPRHRPRRPPAPSRTVVLVRGAFTDTSAWTTSCASSRTRGIRCWRRPIRCAVCSDAGYAASVLKMISGWIIMVGNIFPVARPRSGAESGRSAHPTRRVAMSVYRVVIDVVGTSTSPARRLPLTRSKRRASRSGTFGSPRSPSKAFTSGRRRSYLPHEDPAVLQVRAGIGGVSRAYRRAPSVVIIANTEANRVCVVAQG